MDEKQKKELDLTEFNAYGNMFDISERKVLIGEMLLLCRQEYGLKQSEVSEYLGIKSGTYSTYENGTREAPAEIIVRLSLLYGIPTDVLLQTNRMSRTNFDTQKQIDFLDEQLDEIYSMMTDRENELNPEFADLFKEMTGAVRLMAEKIGELNENQNKKKNRG